MPSRLVIAIPTYNRAQILDETVSQLSGALRALDIPLLIRDDSTDDRTQMRVQAWEQAGITVDYRRNRPPLGHDANLMETLVAADADHVWLMGDAMVPDPACLERIVQSLDGQDFVFLNARTNAIEDHVQDIDAHDLPAFMAQRVWEFTLTGATIYGPRVIEWSRSKAYVSRFPNFCQLGLILHFMQAHADTRVTRYSRRALRSTRRPRESYWAPRAIEVFAGDWCRVIGAHGAVFGPGALPAVIRSHANRTRILRAPHLITLRSQGFFSRADLRFYGAELDAASPVSRGMRLMIAILPMAMARLILRVRQLRKLLRPGKAGAAATARRAS